MYCKKCHQLLENGNTICPNCNFDNSKDENTLLQISSKVKTNKQKNNKQPTIFIIIIIITISLVLILNSFITNTRAKYESNITSPSNITTTIEKYNIFQYDNIKLSYPNTFGSTTSTIFYKDNSNINITFNKINDEEYNNIINSNEILDAKLNTNIETKTYATDTSYGYLLNINNIKYNIIVNFIKDKTIYTEDIQSSISKILNSIVIE